MQDINVKTGNFLKKNAHALIPEILQEWKGLSRKKTFQEEELQLLEYGIGRHLAHLSTSLIYSENGLYEDVIGWAKQYLSKTPFKTKDIDNVLKATLKVFERDLPPGLRENACSFLQIGFSALKKQVSKEAPHLDEGMPLYQAGKDYLGYLLKLQKNEATSLVFSLLNQGISIKEIYMQVFAPVIRETGRLWMEHEQPLAMGHYVTAVTELIMSQLYSHIFKAEKGSRVFIGACVFGELHEIGLRMMSDLLVMEGWNTHYLGANNEKEKIVHMLEENKTDVLGLSVTMSHHLQEAQTIIEEVRSNDGFKDLKIIVGGYAFNQAENLWQKVGADFYAGDAEETLSLLRYLS